MTRPSIGDSYVDMVFSLIPSVPIDTATHPKRKRFRVRRNIPVICFGISCWWWWILSTTNSALVTMFSRSCYRSSAATGKSVRGSTARFLFCSAWSPPNRLHKRVTFATTRCRGRQSPWFSGDFYSCDSALDGGIGSRRTVSTMSTSTTLCMVKGNKNKWEVGDLVSVASKNNDGSSSSTANEKQDTPKGEVVAIQGGGWYSIRLFSNKDNKKDSEEIIKRRGTQLQRLASDSNDVKVTANYDKTTTASKRASEKVSSNVADYKAMPLSSETGSLTIPIKSNNDPQYSVLPPPTICDLDTEVFRLAIGNDAASHQTIEKEMLQQAAHHATYKKWVVFTDLHCSPATLDTCLQVLDIVHHTALQQTEKCGVLFLGDFWHHRGTLRVDCLNAVLGALRSWEVPMVMIPGNHDQVTLGGQNHGLTPLENAYRVGGVPGPLVLSQPTLFRKALFVPHVRDTDAMKAIVGSREANEASALFVHVEVRGALMNDMIVSTMGISPSTFPRHKHIYSGHFHKPHSIETGSSSTIEYIGSPYQISLAEAHQEKQLVVLDANWDCQQRVSLNVGRRHFKMSSLAELEDLRIDGKVVPNTEAKNEDSILVRKGDRIVVNLSTNQPKELLRSEADVALESRVQSLRKQGVMVEVRDVSDNENPLSSSLSSQESLDSADIPELSPESTWRAYLKDAKTRSSVHEDDYDRLLQVGLGILEQIEESPDTIQNGGMHWDLKLTSTSVTGFGPFEDTIVYPLDNRGLVLLRGSNTDFGPDSNGTGKSSLAMATLWALTGSLDARPASDLKVADIVNDNSKVATVSVKGVINNSPFFISRSKGASKGDLVFRINDADLTTQSVKETQALIEEKLGVNAHILSRVAFYGQHGMNDLLGATDSKLKDELSLVVPLDLWQEATSVARAKSRRSKKKVDEMEGMIRLRKSDIDALSNRVARAKDTRDFNRKGLLEGEKRYDRELTRIQELLDRTNNMNVEELQTELEDISLKCRILNDLYDSTITEKEDQLKPLEEELNKLSYTVSSMEKKNTAFQMDARASKISLESARVQMDQTLEKWSVDASRGMPSDFKPPELCPTCGQHLHAEEQGVASDESIKNAQNIMENEIKKAQGYLHSTEDAHNQSSLKASDFIEALDLQVKLFSDLQLNYQNLSSKWNTKLQTLDEQLREKRKIQNTLTSKISTVAKESQLLAQREAANSMLNTEKLNAAHADEVYLGLENELVTAVDFMKRIVSEKEDEANNQSIVSSVGELFGQRGVQTFVLQNTVDSLQRTAQVYLDYLSDGSQRLELSLDAGDKILRNAFVRGADGDFKHRPLSTLSGGQWRRCSLALSFAFAELVASRGRLRSSLLVLDEPLTHLDRSGRAKFGELVRKMLGSANDTDKKVSGFRISTALVILQDLSAEELEEAFDGIDTVVRKDGKSCLNLDAMTSIPE